MSFKIEKIDLAIVNGYHEYPLSEAFYNTVKDQGKASMVITPNGFENDKLLKKGINTIFINDFFPKKTPSTLEIINYFKSKGVESMLEFISTEKAYYSSSNKTLISYSYRYAYAFEEIFKKFNIKRIFQLQGGEVVRRAASLIANEKGVERIYSGESFVPGYSTLYSDEFKSLIYPKSEKSLSAADALEIVNDKLNKKKVSKYDPFHVETGGSKIKKFINLYKFGNYNIINSYLSHKHKTTIKHRHLEITSRKYFQEFDPNLKYFYYPFNVAAESELFIRNSEYSDQVKTVQQIARHLPSDYFLFVKTHPGNEGHLRIEDYKILNKLNNVRLLPATVNSFDVVKNSKGVIIVSSTVGLESYITGKPTCVIGNWPYAQLGNFIIEKDLANITQSISKHSQNEPTKLIQNIYKVSHPGNLFGNREEFHKMVDSILNV